jgi:hypothetical protein
MGSGVRDRDRAVLSRRFEQALRADNFAAAESLARSLPWVSLRDAMRLILIARRRKPARVEPMAVRWLERFLGEFNPSLQLVQWLTEDLHELSDPGPLPFDRQRSEARLRLVVETLKDRERMPTIEEYARVGGAWN